MQTQALGLIVRLGVVDSCALWASLLSRGRTVESSTQSQKEFLRAGLWPRRREELPWLGNPNMHGCKRRALRRMADDIGC